MTAQTVALNQADSSAGRRLLATFQEALARRGAACVEQVIVSGSEQSLVFWVVVDDPSVEERYPIYDAELDLFDAHPEARVSVELLWRAGRPLGEVISLGTIHYSRRSGGTGANHYAASGTGQTQSCVSGTHTR